VLDVGCGVGRWSQLLAAGGADVTGVDISATMIEQAQRRTDAARLTARCRYLVQDIGELDTGERYGLVLGVTTISILGVSIGVLAIDLFYPLLDPRVKVS